MSPGAKPLAIALLAAVAAMAIAGRADAAAELVHRCIENGTIAYSDQPCKEGTEAGAVGVDGDRNLVPGPPRPKADAPAKAASASDSATLRRYKCDALEAQIKAIDLRVKEALAVEEKEHLAELRRDYRQEQLRMRC